MNRHIPKPVFRFLTPVCVSLLLAATAWCQAPPSVVDHIPGDVRGFIVLKDMATTIEKIDALATRFEAPIPNVNAMLGEFEEGLDKKKNVGLAWLDKREGDDEQSGYMHFVAYLPVSDYKAFLAQFNPVDPDAKITAAVVSGQEFVVAEKGDYAIVADVEEQASLEHVLNSKASISETAKPLQGWIQRNDLTLSLTPSGTKLMFSKLQEGLNVVKQMATAGAGDEAQAKMMTAAMGMYQSAFDAGEREFSQVAVGLRIDPEQSVSLHKRVLLSEDGWLSKSSQGLTKPKHAVAGIPAGPFVVAFEGAMPSQWSKDWMAMSVNMLNSMPGTDGEKLTEKQIDDLAESTAEAMKGMKSMAFSMGVGEAKEGIYGRTVGIMRVEDANAFLDNYESAFSRINKLMKGTMLDGAYNVERTEISDQTVLHLKMDMAKFQPQLADAEEVLTDQFKNMFGEDGKISVYLAPADEQSVIMAYSSVENLSRAQEAFRNADTSLANDANLKTTAAMMSDSAQWVGYLSVDGMLKFSGNMAQAFAPNMDWPFADMPSGPPIGFAVELADSHMDAELVIPLETVDGVKDFVMNMGQ